MSWKEQRFLDYYDLPTTVAFEQELNAEFPLKDNATTIVADDIEVPKEMLRFETLKLTVYHSPLTSKSGSRSGTFQLFLKKPVSTMITNAKFTYTSISSPGKTYEAGSSKTFLSGLLLQELWGGTLQLRCVSDAISSEENVIVKKITLTAYDAYASKYSVRQMNSSVRKIQRVNVSKLDTPVTISAVNPEKTMVIPSVVELTPKHIKGEVEGYHQVIEYY